MDITLKQASDLAHMNVSTCRFYKDKYIQYFTTSGEGKKTKFEEKSTVELLILIGKKYKDGLDQEQITQILDERYGINVVTDLVPRDKDNNIEAAQQDILNEVRNIFREEIRTLEEKVDALSRGSEDRDRLLMEALRAISNNNRKKSWKWWK